MAGKFPFVFFFLLPMGQALAHSCRHQRDSEAVWVLDSVCPWASVLTRQRRYFFDDLGDFVNCPTSRMGWTNLVLAYALQDVSVDEIRLFRQRGVGPVTQRDSYRNSARAIREQDMQRNVKEAAQAK